MSRQMPWDQIPESNVFPTGAYHVTGVKLEERFSANGKLMYAADIAIVEHAATAMFTNMHHFENFVIGSDDDLEAQVPGTWVQSFGAKRLKQMLKAAQITEKADMEKICAGFAGVQFVLGLRWYREPELDKQGLPNQYAGQERNDVTGFYKIGVKEPGIEQKAGAAVAGGVKVPIVAPAAPPVSAPVTAPVVAAPSAPKPQAAPVAGVAASSPPVSAPPTPQTTAGGAPPVGATIPADPAPVAAGGATEATLLCQVCNTQVPAIQFAEHINKCLAAQAAQVG